MPVTFEQAYDAISSGRLTMVTSSAGTRYTLEASVRQLRGVATPTILASPANGTIRIHKDCFGQSPTCQGTGAGGVNHGLTEWFAANP